MKGEQIGRKVREIKFPQYIINENFEKMKINFMFLFWNLVILFDFLVYFFNQKIESVFLFCLMGE